MAFSFFSFLVSAFVTFLFLGALFPLLRLHLLDHPNVRSSHQRATPRGGGLAFVFVACFASAISLLFSPPAIISFNVILFMAFPLALVGFFDDRYKLSTPIRYVFQLITALFLILVSPLPSPWIAFPLLLIAVTAVINFTNFTDGLDGLVAGCMAVAISAIAIAISTPWPIWSLVGCLIGFLFWNWSPAKIFMGDVGSTFLGAVYAGLVLQAPSWWEALGLLLVATPLFGDACICVLRRLILGQRVFQAHRLHLFQRLHQAGWSHARVSCLYFSATALLAVALLTGGLSLLISLVVVELLVGFWLDQRVAVPFSVSCTLPL